MENTYGLAAYYGNVDLDKRQVYTHPDGYIQTEHSVGFSPDGNQEVLIPTIVEGKPVALNVAIDHYNKTGEHLGSFDKNRTMTERGLSEEAFYNYMHDYANKIHERQAKHYKGDRNGL